MKKELRILDFEKKLTKAGKPFWRISTDAGWYSCFDGKVSDELRKHINEDVVVEITEKDNFVNITKYYREGMVEGAEEEKDKKSGFKNKSYQAMYVSYVKDLITSGMEKDVAIKAIKDIKEAFE